MRKILGPLVLLITGCATSSPPRDALPNDARATTPTAPRPKADPERTFSCPDFVGLLEARQPRTLAEALAGVARARPGYLQRATFAYETLHDDAGAMFPRAVVYGGDAKMVMSFNGHQKQRGFERLGRMCFDDAVDRFDFREVAFPAEAATPDALSDLSADERARPFVVTEGRGARDCRQCHDQNARPVWDAAALWPGFYGGVNDSLFDARAPDARPIYSALERMRWQAFQSGPSTTARYRHVAVGSARPNSEMTELLSELNGRRIVGDLRRLGEKFVPFRYHFAAALFCAPRGERLELKQSNGPADEGATFAVLPQNADGETREIFLAAYYDQMGKEKRQLAMLKRFGLVQPLPKEHFEELRQYYRGLFREENLDLRLSGVDVDQVLMLRELKRVVEPLGVDVENWSMAFHGGYAFNNGRATPGRPALSTILERPFREAFLRDDPRLAAALEARERGGAPGLDEAVCGVIAGHLTPGPRPASVSP